MDLNFLDENFDLVMTVDVYKSIIWTDRYQTAGDFELTDPLLSREFLDNLKECVFLSIKDSDRLMVIETRYIDNGVFKIQGRSLESILDRRVIRKRIKMTNNLSNVIGHILQENVTYPSNSSRAIPDFVYIPPSDPAIQALTLSADFIGDPVYDTIVMICEAFDIGWCVKRVDDKYKLYLYAGKDRTIDQSTNDQVIFSDNLDNLLASYYTESIVPEKNVAVAAGEKGIGDVADIFDVYVQGAEPSGLNRKEIYIETGVSRNVDGETISEEEYELYILYKAVEKLSESKVLISFDSDVDADSYSFRKDYDLGDIIEVFDEFGNGGKSRVMAVTFSNDINGTKILPIFETI